MGPQATDRDERASRTLVGGQDDDVWLTKLDRVKLDFVSMVSHELKSPLLAIHNYVTVLLRHSAGLDDAERRGLMEIVERESLRLVKLVDDIMITSRLESGQLSCELAPVYLLGLVEEVVAERQSLAPEHRFRIELSGLMPTVRADAARVRQVLINLLDNAIKYSPPSSEVTVRIETALDDRETCVRVRDEGAGIAPEDVPQLFGKFRRLGNHADVPGTGLGLYVSRMLVEAHGGRIWAESAPGSGSTFVFTLPLEEARALGS